MGGVFALIVAVNVSAGKQKVAKKYIETLVEVLLLFAKTFYGEEEVRTWTFQQDGAEIHTSKAMRAWFDDKNVIVMDWILRSPDLTPIENV